MALDQDSSSPAPQTRYEERRQRKIARQLAACEVLRTIDAEHWCRISRFNDDQHDIVRALISGGVLTARCYGTLRRPSCIYQLEFTWSGGWHLLDFAERLEQRAAVDTQWASEAGEIIRPAEFSWGVRAVKVTNFGQGIRQCAVDEESPSSSPFYLPPTTQIQIVFKKVEEQETNESGIATGMRIPLVLNAVSSPVDQIGAFVDQKVIDWLQARFYERVRHFPVFDHVSAADIEDEEPNSEIAELKIGDFHEFLIKNHLPVAATRNACLEQKLIFHVERFGPGQNIVPGTGFMHFQISPHIDRYISVKKTAEQGRSSDQESPSNVQSNGSIPGTERCAEQTSSKIPPEYLDSDGEPLTAERMAFLLDISVAQFNRWVAGTSQCPYFAEGTRLTGSKIQGVRPKLFLKSTLDTLLTGKKRADRKLKR